MHKHEIEENKIITNAAEEEEQGQNLLEHRVKAESLRGGANRFHLLQAEDEEEGFAEETEDESKEDGAHHLDHSGSDEDGDELNTSMESDSSGKRSYYREYFAKKAEMEQYRGGAGGANTTRNKHLTEAIKALAEVMKAIGEDSKEDEVTSVIGEIAKMTQEWAQKVPTKSEMRTKLRAWHVKLEEKAQAPVAPTQTGATDKRQQQSFYTEFAKNIRKEDEEEQQGWRTKGKGKGKSKSKSKKDEKDVIKFDLRHDFPQRRIGPWQLVAKELEEGKEATASITVVDSIKRMVELQEITKQHALQKAIIMVAKREGPEALIQEVAGAKEILLPIVSNLALIKAVVATTTGEEPPLVGIQPKEDKEPHLPMEKPITLRVVVDLNFKDDKVRKLLEEQPHLSLHEMLKGTDCKEMRSHGWKLAEDVITGYAATNPSLAEELLQRSGAHGIFITRLRQDIVELPPCTWIAQKATEDPKAYLTRVQALAKEEAVPMARRNGGGSYLGIQRADKEVKMHAWIAFGVPTGWGPNTVRQWLCKQGWTIGETMRPPNGRFKSWSFQGMASGEEQSKFYYEVKLDERTMHITVQRWKKTRKVEEEEKKYKGSKWWSEDLSDPIEELSVDPTLAFSPEVAPTLVDPATQEGKDVDMTDEKKRSPDDTSKVSPAKKKARGTTSARPRLGGGSAGPQGTTLLDCGGAGDCGWRAISVQIAALNEKNSKSIEELAENAERLGLTLKGKAMGYIRSNKDKWERAWCPDPSTNEIMEDGAIPQNPKEYLKALERKNRWVDGFCLSAIAMIQKCALVVWAFRGADGKNHLEEGWKRIAILKSGSGYLPVVPVVLHGGHYFSLRPQVGRKSFPKEWGTAPEDEIIPTSQDGEDTAEISKAVRGGTWTTPKRKGREDDELEALLRTMSSRRSEEELQLRSCKSSRSEEEHQLRSFRSVRSSTMEEKSFKEEKAWTCPVCNHKEDISGCRQKAALKIQRHIMNLHNALWRKKVRESSWRRRAHTGMGLRCLAEPIAYEKMKNAELTDKACFLCPYCPMALPKFYVGKRNLRQESIYRNSKLKHLRMECTGSKAKEVTLRTYMTDSQREFPWFYAESNKDLHMEAAKKRLKIREDEAIKNGHSPIRLDIKPNTYNGKRCLRGILVCSDCRKCLNAIGKNGKKKCIGKKERNWKVAPGAAFWREAIEQKKVKHACEKLGITKTEYQQIQIRGRKRRDWAKARIAAKED